jgi:carbonic anhydrase
MIEGITILQAASSLDIARARELFVEYAAWLNVDLCFQHFQEELASLPGAYVPPQGCLLLAHADGQAAGCVGLRRFDEDRGEIKRLWVREPFRHARIGRMLINHALDAGRASGYRRLVLDTLPQMGAALALYRSFGFREIPAYYDNPIPGAVYMGMDLD